jgi:2-polyprenyl-3-methyl-5-hydroxy-6-metoxy-1,4-benzoquinol methylase
MSIKYNDGTEVESKILQILQQQSHLSSQSSICSEQYNEWPVRYHLCTERANLLRHLDFTNLEVLEIGAGMGAVSRHIAESCRSLTVLEGTEKRFAALSARLRDLKNWSGQVANFQDAKIDKKFDVVCVIGVLEYSEMFIHPPKDSNDSPFSWFIRKASSYLKDDGVLVLAIENKLGLKYWNGAAEDHSGKIFDGICDYPRSPSPKTFSRKELRNLFSEAGFSRIDEHFPFPDYKIPSTVITQDLIERFPDLAGDLATTKTYENYGNPRLNHYPDLLALRSVTKAGLLADFSNSFLFIASQNSASPIRTQLLKNQLQNQELGWHYSNSRQVPTKTVFRLNNGTESSQNGSNTSFIEVHKNPLYPHEIPSSQIAKLYSGPNLQVKWQTIPETKLGIGEKVESILLSRIYFEEWVLFLKDFKEFLSWSFDNFKLKPENGSSPSRHIRGEALDALFSNALKGKAPNHYELFDLEWALDQPMSKSWYVFRNVFLLLRVLDLFPLSRPFQNLKELYEKLCAELSIQAEFEKDLANEAEFLFLATTSNSQADHLRDLKSLFNNPLSTPDFPRLPRDEVGLKGKYLFLDAHYKALEQKVAHYEFLINSMPHRLAEKLNQLLLRFPIFHKILKVCLGKLSH